MPFEKILFTILLIIWCIFVSYNIVYAADTKMDTTTKSLWGLFIAGQVLSAGNMIYQQEAGYYEINHIYGKHPSKARIYSTKIAETALIYGVTKLYPKYEKHILGGANVICWGFIINDRRKGISFNLRF